MYYIEFEWDHGNEFKIRQRASLEEVESAFYDHKRKTTKTYFNRYQMLARASSGRYLFIVFQRKAGSIIRIISVRDVVWQERKRYRKKWLKLQEKEKK